MNDITELKKAIAAKLGAQAHKIALKDKCACVPQYLRSFWHPHRCTRLIPVVGIVREPSIYMELYYFTAFAKKSSRIGRYRTKSRVEGGSSYQKTWYWLV